MVRRHNPMLYQVLAIGRDISLLSSRANVLTQAGYSTDLVLTPDDAVRRVCVRRYHLVVISPTYTTDEQLAIRSSLRQARQHLPVLLLQPSHDSPDALLAAVADCLRSQFKRLPKPSPGPTDPNHRFR
jgi:DNA-binding NtrC family response regulator